jgi:tight adherence protein B
VSRATLLAFAAAGCATAGVWLAWASVERRRVTAVGRRLAEPVRRARTEGREPTTLERRRLVASASGAALVGGWIAAGALAGAALAVAVPVTLRALVRTRRRRYGAELGAGAAAAARALADAVAAGHSVRGAIAAAAPGVPGAAGRELRRAAGELALGRETVAVVEALRRRAGSPAWDTLAAAILLQREAGGDLAGLLRHLAGSLEQAQRDEAQARTATAQARFTAWLVAGMPFGAAVLAEAGSPGFIAALVAQPLSAALAGAALALQLVAVVLIRRLV